MKSLHRKKIDTCPVLPARKLMKQLTVENDKRRVIKPSKNDSEFLCPIHRTPYKLYSNGHIRFVGYDSNGNKITEPYKATYICHHCKAEGKKFRFSATDVKINTYTPLVGGK
jgi:hypothetical protein